MPDVRKNFKTFTAAERKRFLDAVVELKTTKSPNPYRYNVTGTIYGDFVGIHVEAFEPGEMGHDTAVFLPWHRQYLRLFEGALNATSVGRRGPRITLPYWDWTDHSVTPLTDDFLGGDGTGLLGQVQTGRFGVPNHELSQVLSAPTLSRLREVGGWLELPEDEAAALFTELAEGVTRAAKRFRGRIVERSVTERPFLSRNIGALGVDEPPTATAVAATLAEQTYDTFEPTFENGTHGEVHIFVGGNMAGADSPNDVIFWMHHCNVDRLWAEWHALHPSADPYLPKEEVQDPDMGTIAGLKTLMTPWKTMRPVDVLKTVRLGYVYR
ncbi:tyrosinase family protein [Jidongwangia harbinensis]|uniref:tyrosinase family protein n=1 Tax=Jidongwangia harbinensis TaxID=2878561 RepID=UPI001CD945E1|nr:tyrosinase family protein [Jidongwangia harbinensis]MCA2217516.1 tyrosinase family protein [Jidongwangia harbinensis]